MTRIIRQVNDLLHDECKINNFQFISNNNFTRDVLWRDGLHLNNGGTYLFASKLADFLNDFVLSKKSIWLTEDDNTTVGKDNYKQDFDFSGEVKQNNSIDYNNSVVSPEKVIEKNSDILRNLRMKNVNRLIIGNLNIHSISNKFDQINLLLFALEQWWYVFIRE